MTNIGDIFDFFLFVTDSDGRGKCTAAEASKALEAAQLSKFNQFRAAGTLDNYTQSALAPFQTDVSFTTSAVGAFAKAADFVQTERVVVGDLEYLPALQNELTDALKSELEPIAEHPRYIEKGGNIILYPKKVVTGTLTYLRLPVPPVINAPADASGYPVYTSSGSVQLEMPKAYWILIIKEACVYLGVSLSDPSVLALSQQQVAA